jgi:hypothetical protein
MNKTSRTRKQWLADVGAVLSLLFAALFVWMIVREQRISANPSTAVALVTEKKIEDGGSEGPVYSVVRYTFKTPSGETYRDRANVSSRLYDRLEVGYGFEIQYAADDPTLSRVPGEFDEMFVEAFAVGVQGVLFFGYLGPRRWLRLRRGQPDPILT